MAESEWTNQHREEWDKGPSTSPATWTGCSGDICAEEREERRCHVRTGSRINFANCALFVIRVLGSLKTRLGSAVRIERSNGVTSMLE